MNTFILDIDLGRMRSLPPEGYFERLIQKTNTQKYSYWIDEIDGKFRVQCENPPQDDLGRGILWLREKIM